MEHIKLKVTGMTCGACVSRVSKAALSVAGVHDAKVELDSGLVQASVDAADTVQPALLQALAAAGYPAEPAEADSHGLGGDNEGAATGCGSGTRSGRGCCCGH